jgi:hypothetical protein
MKTQRYAKVRSMEYTGKRGREAERKREKETGNHLGK